MPKLNSYTLIIFLVIPLIPALGFSNNSIKTTQRTVVIDPGHGGAQTGILTSSNLSEKNITLTLALKTAEKLDSRYNILLTRTRDTALLATQRVSIANSNNADLFISIHLARQGIDSGFFHYFIPPPNSILPASSQNTTWKTMALKYTNESKALAKTFFNTFSTNNKALLFSIKASPTNILEGTNMPAILIEPFPVSILPEKDAEREAMLEEYAMLISKSIDSFFKKTRHTQ